MRIDPMTGLKASEPDRRLVAHRPPMKIDPMTGLKGICLSRVPHSAGDPPMKIDPMTGLKGLSQRKCRRLTPASNEDRPDDGIERSNSSTSTARLALQ